VNVIALWALKCAEIKTHTGGHDAGEHHVGIAPRAGWTLKLNVDVLGHEIGFLHEVFPHKAGARYSQSPVCALMKYGDEASIDHRIPGRCSILIRVQQDDARCSTRPFGHRLDLI